MKESTIGILIVILNYISFGQNYQWNQTSLDSVLVHDILIYDRTDIYAAVMGGVYFTSNQGENWIQKNNGLLTEPLKIIRDNTGNLYTAGLGGIFKSANLGDYWFKISSSIPTNEFYSIALTKSGALIVGSLIGIFYSSDFGNTWHSTNYTGWGIQEIITFSDSLIFAANNTAPYSGIFKSNSDGNYWDFNAGFSSKSLYNIDDAYLLCGSQFPPDIYFSLDSGNTWLATNSFINATDITDIVGDEEGNLYCSVIVYPSCNLYCDVYKSIDYGYSWENTGLLGKEIHCLAIDSSGTLYTGTQSEGIFIYERIVPVELISFTSSVIDNDVTLNWQTATETNNQGFQIERRKTQDERSEEWNSIGFVNGNGTTSETQSYSFVDKNLLTGKYQYRLKQKDFDGTFEYSNTIEVEINSPTKFSLEQNFPNPFNPSTNIQYAISSRQFVTLKVFDVLGKEVATLVNEEKPSGIYNVQFTMNNLSSGIYYYQLRAGDFIETKKMIMMK